VGPTKSAYGRIANQFEEQRPVKVKNQSNSESNLISSFIERPRFTGVIRACEEPVKVSLRLAALDLD
jgi:hypothetical protein